MRIKNILLLSILFIACNMGVSQEKTPLKNTEELIKKLEKLSSTTTSIDADFSEEKYLSFMKEPQLSSGKFYYKQENKMRWEQQLPFSYIMLVNEDAVKIKDGDKEKDYSLSNKMMAKIKELMITLIKGDFNDNKAFAPSYFETTDSYIVQLDPTNKRLKNIFDMIELSIDKKTLRLKTLTFNEKSGDKSVMSFFNEKFNTSINDQIFSTF